MSRDRDPRSRSQEAKRAAEQAQAVALRRARLGAFRKHRNGTFAVRKDIGDSHQVVVPADVVKRWGGVGVTVLIFDLEWAVLVVPQEEARVLFADLDL